MSQGRGRIMVHGRDREDNRRLNLQDNTGRSMPQPRPQNLRDPRIRSRIASNETEIGMVDENILNELYKLPDANELLDTSQSQSDGYSDHSAPPNFQREQSNQGSGAKYTNKYNDAHSLPLALQHPPGMVMRSQMAQPSLPAPSCKDPENLITEERIEPEVVHQTISPSKQIEGYKKKAALLRKEWETLKEQRTELRGDGTRSPSPDTKRFLKDNTKLQLEIQKKLKNINDLMELLNGLIGEDSQETQESDEPPDQKCKSRSPPNRKINYVFYDPEMHWCRVCNEFPPTAKDYLNHLHSAEHQQNAAQHMEAPWHSLPAMNEGYPIFPSAPTKRTPIKGLQFFVPTTAWYCKLCDQFMGDLHCASSHIKSMMHSKNYTNFVEQNPHWETDWMSDRQKAFEQARTVNKSKPAEDNASCSLKYTAHTITISKDFQNQQQRESVDSPAGEKQKLIKKKRKERSVSLSSVSDSSQSDSSNEKKSKKKKPKAIEMADSKDLEEWVTSIKKRVINKKLRERSTSRDRERIREMQRKIRESESRGFRVLDNRDGSRDSRDRRDGSRDSRDRRDGSRDSRDRRDNGRAWGDDRQGRRDSRADTRDRRDERLDRRDERRDDHRNYRGENRDRRAETRDREDERQDRRDETDKSEKEKETSGDNQHQLHDTRGGAVLQAEPAPREKLSAAMVALPPPALALPAALAAAQPPPQVLPPPVPPPLQPPVPSLIPTPGEIPSVPKEFQDALEMIFPTDPEKCSEMLQQQGLFGAMPQQQSLLGMPPALGLQYGPLGLMQPPGMFGYDLGAGLYPSPLLSAGLMLHTPRGKTRGGRGSRARSRPPRGRSARGRPGPRAGATGEGAPALEAPDDLTMLGIDSSDVGAGI